MSSVEQMVHALKDRYANDRAKNCCFNPEARLLIEHRAFPLFLVSGDAGASSRQLTTIIPL